MQPFPVMLTAARTARLLGQFLLLIGVGLAALVVLATTPAASYWLLLARAGACYFLPGGLLVLLSMPLQRNSLLALTGVLAVMSMLLGKLFLGALLDSQPGGALLGPHTCNLVLWIPCLIVLACALNATSVARDLFWEWRRKHRRRGFDAIVSGVRAAEASVNTPPPVRRVPQRLPKQLDTLSESEADAVETG